MEKIVIITGTNASGKSGLGIDLACSSGAEIVSADSRQVFKGLDLGSGKVTREEMKGVPHYLLDVAEPNDFFSLKDYQKMAYDAIDDILARGRRAYVVGGTGLYVSSIACGYVLSDAEPDTEVRAKVEAMTIDELIDIIRQKDPSRIAELDLKNKRRLERAAEKVLAGAPRDLPSDPRYETLIIGVTWPRDILYERIRVRLEKRLAQGLLDEVADLRKNGAEDIFLYKLGLEYRYCLMYLRGEFPDYGSFFDKLFMEIRHLAKEQMTWFRKLKNINWIDMQKDPLAEADRLIEEFYGGHDNHRTVGFG
ncbi:MAG: tRNA (adenosine(37)-N6)-dimethylallyltransferase MiaA [Lachnospiraceae bacterium]|nr:tRNA (adenosine(37)-N6)-dimethylallyltransferase MiaA [Lachnospiraceae bacterium]